MAKKAKNRIRVVELFAGVGGFRIGLEGASDAFETVWSNQWEPSTKHQDASLVYVARFGSKTKSFPSTVALNKLYYFMPYIKGKGVKDLYLIKIARIGSKEEILPESNDAEPRLVFELEYIKSLTEYHPVKLTIFHTYRDTVLGSVWE